MIRTPGFIRAMVSASIMLRVSGIRGTWRVIKSERAKRSSRETSSTSRARGGFLADVGVGGDHIHVQPFGPFGHHPADVAQADDAEGFTGDLDPGQRLLLPAALPQGSGSLGNVAGQGQHQGNGVFGGGDGIAPRGVHHHDPFAGGGLDIDVVHADAGAADHLEAVGVLEDLGWDFGAASYRQRIEFALQSWP